AYVLLARLGVDLLFERVRRERVTARFVAGELDVERAQLRRHARVHLGAHAIVGRALLVAQARLGGRLLVERLRLDADGRRVPLELAVLGQLLELVLGRSEERRLAAAPV